MTKHENTVSCIIYDLLENVGHRGETRDVMYQNYLHLKDLCNVMKET